MSYDSKFYKILSEVEERHWWFTSRLSLILWCLKEKVQAFENFIEIGCGTGFVLRGIHNEFPEVSLSGTEYLEEGLFCARKKVPSACLKKLNALDMNDHQKYDSIGAFDVIEHIENDGLALSNLAKALKKNGTTILLTTHFMEEAEKLCDNISIIDSGEIKLSGNPQSLISENLPKYILETTNVETINFLEKNSQHYDRKIENYTNTYCLNDLVVTNDLKDMQGTIIRPSNLEDLFLHITGHQLRE